MRTKRMLALAGTLAVIATACKSTEASDGPPPSAPARDSSFDPDDFVEGIDNPLFPLEPGTVFHMRGESEDGLERETITVTNRTKRILGVSTTVVKDVVRVDGELKELTHDWYAQDRDGNVWYFGENTAEYEDGKIANREGAWEAGMDGAEPGIIMNADPQVTDSYRQEYYAGEAEDMYWVVALDVSITVPFGHFDAVHTLEWSPLEPKIVEEKFYAPGIGLLAERTLTGPREALELVDVIRPEGS